MVTLPINLDASYFSFLAAFVPSPVNDLYFAAILASQIGVPQQRPIGEPHACFTFFYLMSAVKWLGHFGTVALFPHFSYAVTSSVSTLFLILHSSFSRTVPYPRHYCSS